MDDDIERLLRQSRARRTLPDPPVRKMLRERAGLSQSQLGAAVGPGVSGAAVSRWESGQRLPNRHLAEAYADLLAKLAREVLT